MVCKTTGPRAVLLEEGTKPGTCHDAEGGEGGGGRDQEGTASQVGGKWSKVGVARAAGDSDPGGRRRCMMLPRDRVKWRQVTDP